MKRHVIAEVRFSQAAQQGRPSSEAPLLCTCSAVVTSGTWDEHRGLSTVQERQARAHAVWREKHGVGA